MKVYTIYTDSHERMYQEHFLPSLPHDVELCPLKVPQYSITSKHEDSGWKETMLEKVNVILQAIEDNWGSTFIYADCDIQFFKPFIHEALQELGECDIAYQWDWFQYCAGFFIARANQTVKDLYTEIKDNYHLYSGDQEALNCIIKNKNYNAVRLSDKFWHFGLLGKGKLWEDTDIFRLPDNMVLHHANWTSSTEDKIKLLELVRTRHTHQPRNIISFSLLINDPKATIGAIENAKLAKDIYPGWICKYYISDDIPSEVVAELNTLDNVEIEIRPGDGYDGLFWRFYAAADIDANYIIFRDVDSRLSIREKCAVDEWIETGKILHIMRDHPTHQGMSGGMWGVKGGTFMNMDTLIEACGKRPTPARGDDEKFLNNVIAKNVVNYQHCIHDSNSTLLDFPCYVAPLSNQCGEVHNVPPSTDPLKIYTIYSTTHEHLFNNFFLPSLPAELDLVAIKAPDISATGEYNKPGWHEFMKEKIELILTAIDVNWGDVFIYSDCDVQFFGNISSVLLDELGEYNIAFQNEHNTHRQHCAGFFIARANERTKDLFLRIHSTYNLYSDDQHALNEILRESDYNVTLLSNKFWTIGQSTSGQIFNHNSGIRYSIPSDILVHHGNFVIGMEEKNWILNYVRDVVGDSSIALKLQRFIDNKEYNVPTVLGEIMSKCGSDKWGGHNYTPLYMLLFGTLRTSPLNVFEMGLGTANPLIPSNMGPNARPGASLYGWKKFFPNAKIYGADIDRDVLFYDDRIKTYYCDQLSDNTIKYMWEAIGDIKMDIIIDDGLHTFDANYILLKNSIDKLNEGGYYIIEDLNRDTISSFTPLLSTIKQDYDLEYIGIVELPEVCKNNWNSVLVLKK